MEHRIYILVAWLAAVEAPAQVAPAIEWQRCYGGTSGDLYPTVVPTDDGGYILSGTTGSSNGDISGQHGGDDAWVARLDGTGGILWQKCLGGTGSDRATYAQQLPGGGFILAGMTDSNDGDVSGNHGGIHDAWAVKLDDAGGLEWQKCLGGTGDDQASFIRPTTDGGYILSCTTTSNDGDVSGNHGTADYWVVKLDDSGNIEWQKCLGGSDGEVASCVVEVSDGYIVSGHTDSENGQVYGNHGMWDIWVVKLDAAGAVVWSNALGGSNGDTSCRFGLATANDGVVICGSTSSNNGDVSMQHGSGDIWLLVLNTSGILVWEKTLGGTGLDQGGGAQRIPGDGYIVVGSSLSNDGDVSGGHGGNDSWVVKLDEAGELVWQKPLGGSATDLGNYIHKTSDGGYIVGSNTSSDDGDVIDYQGGIDMWVVKLQGSPDGMEAIEALPYSIAPNPSDGMVRIETNARHMATEVLVTDASGQLLFRDVMPAGEMHLDLRHLTSGSYVITLRSDRSLDRARVVIE